MNLRQLRKNKNLTIKEVAEILGISEIQLSRIERGTRGLRVAYAIKLGELYGVDWASFYTTSSYPS